MVKAVWRHELTVPKVYSFPDKGTLIIETKVVSIQGFSTVSSNGSAVAVISPTTPVMIMEYGAGDVTRSKLLSLKIVKMPVSASKVPNYIMAGLSDTGSTV